MYLKKLFFCALLLPVFATQSTFAQEEKIMALNKPAHAPAASEGFKEIFVTVPQGKLFCRVMGHGHGQTPVIVLHGGPGVLSQDYLLPFMGRLAKTNQVIFYDQRGSGRSQATLDSSSIKIENFIEDIEAIRKALGLKKITLLGHSWGGLLSMHYAILHPESLDKLILMDSMAASSQGINMFLQEWYRRLSPHKSEMNELKESEAFLAGDPETVANYLRIIFRTYCFQPGLADKLNLTLSASANVSGNKTFEILRKTYFARSYDLTNDLKKLTCKTLIIHGDSDVIPLQTAKNIHANIASSELVVIEKCGHFPFMEKPEPCFHHLNAFLSK